MAIVKRFLRVLSFIACIVYFYLSGTFAFIEWVITGKSKIFRVGYQLFYYTMEGKWSNG